MRCRGAHGAAVCAAAALCLALALLLPAGAALAIIPGREAPVPVQETWNPRPDADDLLLPMPCDLKLALRAVTLPGGSTYFIGKYELSDYQWQAVMTGNCEALSTGLGALPLREKSLSEVRDFLARYNAWLTRERRARPAAFVGPLKDAGEARLPAGAEWEFAALGGQAVPAAERRWNIPPDKLREYAVISDPSPIQRPERIGSRQPNPLGLYDVLGNVKEMVAAASDGAIAFKGGSFRLTVGELRLGEVDEVTRYNDRGEERRVGDLGLRLALSGPGHDSALAERALRPEAANGAAGEHGGGVSVPLALALSIAAFLAGGLLCGAAAWLIQRRRLGMPVAEELALQEDLTKWRRGYQQARAALNKTLKEAARREEAGLAAEQRADETKSALAQTLKAAAAGDEARREALARAEAAEKRAEEAVARNESITRAAEAQIQAARAELEALRKRVEEAEARASAAEQHAEEAEAALREQREDAEATRKQATERAEAALAQARAELEALRQTAEAAEAKKAAAEERARQAGAQAEEAAKQARAAVEQARAALTELEQVRQLAEEREAMRLRAEEEARQAAEQARLAAEQAKEAAEQARRARMELEQLLAAAWQGQQPPDTPVPKPEPQPRPAQASPRPAAQSEPPKTCTNSIGVEFVLIPAGTFWMGSGDDDSDAYDDEKLRHEVRISRPFLLGRHPVTQAQWESVMGSNPSCFKGPDRPVEQVSWDDVQKFIRELNAKEGHTRYRLPTEAEWEYACRAGATSRYCFGDDTGKLGDYAWYDDNSGEKTHSVGQKLPNPWGLYDMHGNVWEWVQDSYSNFSADSVTDPQGPTVGGNRVLRGGGWGSSARDCRVSNRNWSTPGNCLDEIGFRLALDVE